MSADFTSPSSQRKLIEHPLFLLLLTSVVLPLLMGAAGVWYSQGRTLERMETMQTEQKAIDSKVEANRQDSQQQLKDLREHTITRGEFDLYKETVKEIREDVREIRRVQNQGR